MNEENENGTPSESSGSGKLQDGAKHRTSNIEHRTSKEEGLSGEKLFNLEDRLLEYAARVIRLVDGLPSSRAATHVGNQLLRSGTSPLPNHGEAQAAESINDFIHKLKICLKELRESYRWLRLIQRVPLIDKPGKVDALLSETIELIRIFVSSVRKATARKENSSRIKEAAAEEDPSMFDVGCSMFDVKTAGLPDAGDLDASP